MTFFAAAHRVRGATGAENPDLASFDRLMTSFVTEHKVPGASLAVARHGKLIYARGFGFADVDKQEPVKPDSLFRIASVSKPFTAAAIMQLVEKGKLRLDDKWLDVLALSPRPEQHLDPRLKKITILELLQHRGGWDRDKSFDPMFRPIVIAREMGSAPPAGPDQIIQYMLGKPLDFDPGQSYAYSNFGYCILGRVIEKVSGETYENYVREHVLAPLGIHDMRIGRSLLELRAPHEVRYYGRGNGASVFSPHVGVKVPSSYGGWNLEAMDSHGAWIASAVDLVRFATAFDEPDHSKILSAQSIAEIFSRPAGDAGFDVDGKPKPVYYGAGWEVRHVNARGGINTWHNGLLDGTSSLLVRRHDGLAWAVLFNASHDPDRKVLASIIDPLVHKAADQVRHWPDKDLFSDYLK
ncbi:MAG TPA: serine hydrolase domain-containing protein [Tepidisphaeraceae bacterium]|jgi:N-acyl-D-amino-acid deacylase